MGRNLYQLITIYLFFAFLIFQLCKISAEQGNYQQSYIQNHSPFLTNLAPTKQPEIVDPFHHLIPASEVTEFEENPDENQFIDQIDLELMRPGNQNSLSPLDGTNSVRRPIFESDQVDFGDFSDQDDEPIDATNKACYVQTCDQTITGRNLLYERALEIIQNEEYLEAADLDIIRKRVKRSQFAFRQNQSFLSS